MIQAASTLILDQSLLLRMLAVVIGLLLLVAMDVAKLTADAPSGLPIPAVVRVPGSQGDRQ